MKKRIVESTIKALQPPARGNQIIYDREISGFGVRITANRAISFILEYSIHGRQRRFTIGPWPDLSATAARAKALELRGGVANGSDPLAVRAERRAAPTMKELSDRYLDEYAVVHKRASSIREDRYLLKTVLSELGALKVDQVRPDDISRMHRRLRETPYRANRILSLLSKMMSLAFEWGLRSDNPVQRIQRYPEQRRERWLQVHEIGRLNVALDAYPDRSIASAIRLALLTGARRGEVLKAQWREFDLQRGVWTKPSHHTKQKRTEHVPLNPPALALLRSLRQQANGELLFPGRVEGQPLLDIKKSWAAIRKAAGIGEDVRFHDLRHSFASHLASRGVSLHIVGKLLGHTKSATTERYAHLADEALREATGHFGTLVENAGENGQPAEVVPLPRTAASD